MPPKKSFRDIERESEAELDVYQAEQEEAQERAGRDRPENFTGAGTKKPRLRSMSKAPSTYTPEGYERMEELSALMGGILKQVIQAIKTSGIPEHPDELDLDLPEGVRLTGLLYPHKKVKCPQKSKDCKDRKFVDLRVLLKREKISASISFILRHILDPKKHATKKSLIEVGPGETESFRDLVYVLLNDGPRAKKTKAPKKTRRIAKKNRRSKR